VIVWTAIRLPPQAMSCKDGERAQWAPAFGRGWGFSRRWGFCRFRPARLVGFAKIAVTRQLCYHHRI
jgi:hypothetical protein